MHQIEQNITQARSFRPIIYKTIDGLVDTNSYLPIPNCLLEYITTNSKLSDADKLIFLHKYAISFFELRSNKERTISSSLQRTSKKFIWKLTKMPVCLRGTAICDPGDL